MSPSESIVEVRNTQSKDFSQIVDLSRAVYPEAPPWSETQLNTHVEIFPQGQLVAVDRNLEKVVGMASSLVISWDEYEIQENWQEFTDGGRFTNHDLENGRTLYGAEVMVHPDFQGKGIGKKLYQARRELAQTLGLLRIRAGARLRGYHRYAEELTAKEYVLRVVRGELKDATLTFQLRQGFEVMGVVPNYLRNDPESLGFAAVIEWLNPKVAKPNDYAKRNPTFLKENSP